MSKLRGPSRWTPPTTERQKIMVHPMAVEALVALLMYDPEMQGVGYTEFIMRAVEAAKDEGADLTPPKVKEWVKPPSKEAR